MKKLNDDNCQLEDSRGRRTTRNLVQFVEFSKFQNDGVQLAKEVLEKLPRQVEEYYMMMNIGPNILAEINARPTNQPPVNVPVVNPFVVTNPVGTGQP